MSMDAENLLLRQQEIQGRIARAYDNLKKAGAGKITAGLVEARLSTLDANWTKFDSNHETLISAHRKALSAHDYITNDFYTLTEEKYLAQKGAFLDLLANFRRSNHEQPGASAAKPTESTMRKTLPRIQLPQFSGAYEEWPAFRDLFHSMVDKDPSLENVERFHYLKTCLKGEASLLLRNLPTTAESYAQAWKITHRALCKHTIACALLFHCLHFIAEDEGGISERSAKDLPWDAAHNGLPGMHRTSGHDLQ